MDRAKIRIDERKKRARRVRKLVSGTQQRPRMSVRRSLMHIYAQIIDDDAGKTIVQIGSSSKEVKERLGDKNTKTEVAKIVGEAIAEKAVEQGVKQVVFDRKGYPFSGRIKAVADGARSKGLSF